jgi:hypothetical protein
MTLRTGGGHRRHASSLREGDVLGRTGDAGQLTAINRSSNQAIKQSSNQASIFITEEQGRTIECTERQGFWRFAQEFGQTSREAQQLVYSVDSIVLPCSSVLKHFLDYFIAFG